MLLVSGFELTASGLLLMQRLSYIFKYIQKLSCSSVYGCSTVSRNEGTQVPISAVTQWSHTFTPIVLAFIYLQLHDLYETVNKQRNSYTGTYNLDKIQQKSRQFPHKNRLEQKLLQQEISTEKKIKKDITNTTRKVLSKTNKCGFLCLKYYRASRHRMRCVTIVRVEQRYPSCKNKWSSPLEDNVYLQRLNGITICLMFVLVQNCVRVKCIEYKL